MIVGIVGLALLTGCSAQPVLQEADYVKLVHENVPEVATATTKQLRAVGEDICNYVKNDGWVAAVKYLVDGSVTAGHAGAFIRFAVTEYCPDLTTKLPN